jgi:periplasmic protein CpxP/Spy
MKKATLVLSTLLLGAGITFAQQAPPGDNTAPPPPMGHRPPMERAFHVGPPGRWWNNPDIQQKLDLSADQQKRMDEIFQQNRLKLIDLHANVEKQEALLEPLLASDQPDESQVTAQIDRVAQARADLEKQNARMLLGLRRVLTADQWQKLKAMAPPPGHGPHHGIEGRGPRRGPGGSGPQGGPDGNGPQE